MSAKLLSMTGEPVETTRPLSIEELRDRSGFDHVSVLEIDTVVEGRVVPRAEQTTVPMQMMVMLSEVGEMHKSSFFE